MARIVRKAPNTGVLAKKQQYMPDSGKTANTEISSKKVAFVDDLTRRLKNAREDPVTNELSENKWGRTMLNYRLRVMHDRKLPLSEFLTFIPLQCDWCKIERPPEELYIVADLMSQCINKKKCNIERVRTLKPKPPTKKRIIRKAAPVKKAARRKSAKPPVG